MHQWMLVEAERASIRGKRSKAESFYQKAIELSREHLFLHYEAVANERFARHCLACADHQRAQSLFATAIDLYRKWGAERKRIRLMEEYQSLFMPDGIECTGSVTTVPASSSAVSAGFSLAQIDVQLFSEAMNFIAAKADLKAYFIRLSHLIMSYAGARRVLLLLNGDRLSVGVDNDMGKAVRVLIPLSPNSTYPHAMLQYVRRTRKALLIDDAACTELFANDVYIREHRIKSAFCLPVLHQDRLSAILYLENNLNSRVFTLHHQKILTALCQQIALLLENEALKKRSSTGDQPPVTEEMLLAILHDEFGLTPQEAKISVRLKRGSSRREICEALNISTNTLKRHLQVIYDKTVNLEEGYAGSGRVDKLSRLILFLFKLCEAPMRKAHVDQNESDASLQPVHSEHRKLR